MYCPNSLHIIIIILLSSYWRVLFLHGQHLGSDKQALVPMYHPNMPS